MSDAHEPSLEPGDVEPDPPPEAPRDVVYIQSIICGRCGWPNACRVQQGMRILRFMCQWCGRMATGIVDSSLKRTIIF